MEEGLHREDAKGAKEEKEWKRDSPRRREGSEGREGVEEGLHREDAKGAKEEKELG